jgi:hypothetical protein
MKSMRSKTMSFRKEKSEAKLQMEDDDEMDQFRSLPRLAVQSAEVK